MSAVATVAAFEEEHSAGLIQEDDPNCDSRALSHEVLATGR